MASDNIKQIQQDFYKLFAKKESQQARFQSTSGVTTCDDPERMIWYGPCMYWTDDWTKVADRGIPCCPVCGAPGFQMTYYEWFEGAIRFSMDTEQPGYAQWVESIKETCSPDLSQWKRRAQTASPTESEEK